MKQENILWFKEIKNKDVGLVGGKNASLGEMYQMSAGQGVKIPNGFAITAAAFFSFLKNGDLEKKLRLLTTGFNTGDSRELKRRGKTARELVLKANFPSDLEADIAEAYPPLEKQIRRNIDVAVRSSATAEDLPTASFAGQQETYLNVRGVKDLLLATKKA